MDKKTLRELMDSRKLTKHSLAQLTGASVRTVEGWLAGRPISRIAQKTLRAL